MDPWLEQTCPRCGKSELLSPADAHRRLAKKGKLKRAKEPEFDMIKEVYRAVCEETACPGCGHQGLQVSEADPDDDWDDDVRCKGCNAPIDRERIELFPDTQYCMACQRDEERRARSGEDDAEPEYCPRCGNIMQLRAVGGSGIARYTMACPSCQAGRG